MAENSIINTYTTNKKKGFWEKYDLTSPSDPLYKLKIGIWIVFLLWIFEGALRKWFLPFLSMPLLIVRDPIVLWLIFMANKKELLKYNIYLTGMTILGAFCFLMALFFGHGNVFVALYGARTLLLYFPLIFVIGRVFDQQDVVRLGRMLLVISIVMTVLIGLQFYSPQSAWVNRGVGGDEAGAGFGGALGYFRPPGFFSFTNGTTCFYSLVAPFILYFWLNPTLINRTILILATVSLIAAIPLSISRGLSLQVGVSVFFLLIAVVKKPKYFIQIILSAFLIVLVFKIFSNVGFFKTAAEAFTDRFEGANETEGGLVEGVFGERFLGQLIKAVIGSGDKSFFGAGLGIGTTLGAQLTGDNSVVLAADYEWMREIGELGLMGLFVIAIRVGLTFKIAFASYSRIKSNNILPWLMASLGMIIVVQGQWHQPTALGFCGIVGGLWLASFRQRSQVSNSSQPSETVNHANQY
ncbi:MAG: hypothetical protein PSX81_13840 [bacterium]|nr:hypothetical protein [bacterium]